MLETLGHKILKVVNYSEGFPSIVKNFPVESVQELVKIIVFRYLKFRFLSFTKLFNQNLSNETSKRGVLYVSKRKQTRPTLVLHPSSTANTSGARRQEQSSRIRLLGRGRGQKKNLTQS